MGKRQMQAQAPNAAYVNIRPSFGSFPGGRSAPNLVGPVIVSAAYPRHNRPDHENIFDNQRRASLNCSASSYLEFGVFWIEFTVAVGISSVSLFADSTDFFEDSSVNFLIGSAISSTTRNRPRGGVALAVILLLPDVAIILTVWKKFNTPVWA
jgi:Co/Zn/Cd efflux system component